MKSISSAAILIIREELLFEKICVKADVYRTSDNSSQIIIYYLFKKSGISVSASKNDVVQSSRFSAILTTSLFEALRIFMF